MAHSFYLVCGTPEAVPFPFLLEHSSWVVRDGASPVSTRVFPHPGMACPDTNHLFRLLVCRRSADSFNCYWQLNHEAAADRFVFLDADRTAVVFHNSAYNGEPQSRAALLGSKISKEQPFFHVERK